MKSYWSTLAKAIVSRVRGDKTKMSKTRPGITEEVANKIERERAFNRNFKKENSSQQQEIDLDAKERELIAQGKDPNEIAAFKRSIINRRKMSVKYPNYYD